MIKARRHRFGGCAVKERVFTCALSFTLERATVSSGREKSAEATVTSRPDDGPSQLSVFKPMWIRNKTFVAWAEGVPV